MQGRVLNICSQIDNHEFLSGRYTKFINTGKSLNIAFYQIVKLVLYSVTRILIGISYKYQKFSTYMLQVQALHLHSKTITWSLH